MYWAPIKLLPGLGGVCLELKVIFDKKKYKKVKIIKSIKNFFAMFLRPFNYSVVRQYWWAAMGVHGVNVG